METLLRRHLGGIWRHLGGIWGCMWRHLETSRRHQGGTQRHSEGIQRHAKGIHKAPRRASTGNRRPASSEEFYENRKIHGGTPSAEDNEKLAIAWEHWSRHGERAWGSYRGVRRESRNISYDHPRYSNVSAVAQGRKALVKQSYAMELR